MNEVRLDAPTSVSVVRTDDGRLYCEGAFAKDGILEYRRPDGTTIRELRRPETNADPKTLEGFKLLPMTVEHPPIGLLNSSNYKKYTVGTANADKYDPESGCIVGSCSFFDSEAIAYIESKNKVELSAGYRCDIKPGGGEWNGQRYDQEQVNVRPNHLALTAKGRAGSDVGLRLDAADSEAGIGVAMVARADSDNNCNGKTRMASVRIDAIEYENIPESFASAVGAKLSELERRAARADSVQSRYDAIAAENADLTRQVESLRGRLDGYDVVLGNADMVLASLGYERDDSGIYGEIEGFEPDDYDDDIEDDDDEDLDEYEITPFDDEDDEMRGDSVADRMQAWVEAESLIPGFTEEHFDSELSASEVRRWALAEADPTFDPHSRSDSYIAGAMKSLVGDGDDEEDDYNNYRGDSYDSYGLDEVIASQGGRLKVYNSRAGLYDHELAIANAYKQNLTVSKN